MHVRITYYSNYNGVDVVIDGVRIEPSDVPSVGAAVEEMIDWASPMCDDDGYFEGNFDELTVKFTAIVHEHISEFCSVEVIRDTFSS